MDLTKIDCEDGMWVKLDKDHAQQRALVLVMVKLLVLLPEKLGTVTNVFSSLSINLLQFPLYGLQNPFKSQDLSQYCKGWYNKNTISSCSAVLWGSQQPKSRAQH